MDDSGRQKPYCLRKAHAVAASAVKGSLAAPRAALWCRPSILTLGAGYTAESGSQWGPCVVFGG